VNNFGYYEDIERMELHREKGRKDYQLIYVKKGEIIISEKGDERVLSSGGICRFRPNEAQIYRISGIATTFFWIHFSGREAAEMLAFFKEQIYSVGVFPDFENYCQVNLEERNIANDFSKLLYEGRLITLIAKIAERICSDNKKESDIEKIRPALAAMQSENQAALQNQELARLCGFSKYYFIKLFAEIMGKTPQQYHASVVVDKGCYLLVNTEYNVSEISRLCGIEDSLYFSRLFKKHMGVSPSQYRKMQK
jgi:AraC-like DNA-binding protein